MTLNESSRRIGKYDRFFTQMKGRNRDKFDHILLLGNGNLVKGYHRYNDELTINIDGFVALYNELEHNRLVLPFTKHYKYQHSYIAHTALRIEDVEVRYGVASKLPLLIEQMTEYLENKGVL